jgi:transposase InsO family protein
MCQLVNPLEQSVHIGIDAVRCHAGARGAPGSKRAQEWLGIMMAATQPKGFLYLVAIIDWASRAVLAWRLSNTMDTAFCLAALDEALARFGTPDIFNTNQGTQFTSAVFTGRLAAAGIAILMDGRGRWMDNVFIERVWRSLKYEEVHLKAYADGREARAGIGEWMIFYNTRRFHQSLGYKIECRRDGHGHAATLGQRKSVAHMPTAATTNSDSDSSLISKQETAEFSTLTQPARGPVYGGHLTLLMTPLFPRSGPGESNSPMSSRISVAHSNLPI